MSQAAKLAYMPLMDILGSTGCFLKWLALSTLCADALRQLLGHVSLWSSLHANCFL